VKRVYSLKGKKSYSKVFVKGRKKKGKGVVVFVLKDNTIEETDNQDNIKKIKVGISISKKIGKANKRNLLKRRVRSICHELLNDMNDGLSVIVKPYPESLYMSYSELKSDIEGLFRYTGVINEKS